MSQQLIEVVLACTLDEEHGDISHPYQRINKITEKYEKKQENEELEYLSKRIFNVNEVVHGPNSQSEVSSYLYIIPRKLYYLNMPCVVSCMVVLLTNTCTRVHSNWYDRLSKYLVCMAIR